MELPGAMEQEERDSLTQAATAEQILPAASDELSVAESPLPPPPLPPVAPPRAGRKKLAAPPARELRPVPGQLSSGDRSPNRARVATNSSMFDVHRQHHRRKRVARFANTWSEKTAAQLEYKKKMLATKDNPEGDSWAHQYHHVYERFTRRHVMCTSSTLGFLGLVELCLLWVWLGLNEQTHDPFQAGLVGYGWTAIAPLSMITGGLGYYGAWRIKHDLQLHIRDLQRMESEIVRVREDHGQKHWNSHRALMAYFYLAFFTGAFMVVVAVVTLNLGLDETNPAMQRSVAVRREGEGVALTSSEES